MKKILLLTGLLTQFLIPGFAQTDSTVVSSQATATAFITTTAPATYSKTTSITNTARATDEGSPYNITVKRDLPITLGLIGLNALGVNYISKKNSVPREEADLRAANPDQVNSFDRFVAGNYDEKAKKLSDLPFYGSFVAPLALLLDKDIYREAPKVFLLYGETMSVTGALFSMTAGLVDRKRPLTYGFEAPLKDRTSKNARNSFFAGHPAATASATFFVAKVFHDFNPDSPARPYVWAVAAAVPATVGYLRMQAGKHFLSDVLIGYTIGTSVGILVPQLHKKASAMGVSISPVSNRTEGNGLAFNYTF